MVCMPMGVPGIWGRVSSVGNFSPLGRNSPSASPTKDDGDSYHIIITDVPWSAGNNRRTRAIWSTFNMWDDLLRHLPPENTIIVTMSTCGNRWDPTSKGYQVTGSNFHHETWIVKSCLRGHSEAIWGLFDWNSQLVFPRIHLELDIDSWVAAHIRRRFPHIGIVGQCYHWPMGFLGFPPGPLDRQKLFDSSRRLREFVWW